MTAKISDDGDHETVLRDLEAELELSDKDEVIQSYRQKRLQELRQDLSMSKDVSLQGDGMLHTGQSDTEILHWTTCHKKAIVHFYHPDYTTCKVLDEHLKVLAERFKGVFWARVSVLQCPFLVAKLAIKILPRLDIFLNGVKLDAVTGFESLGGTNKFTTRMLIQRLALSGILKSSPLPSSTHIIRDGSESEKSLSDDDERDRSSHSDFD